MGVWSVVWCIHIIMGGREGGREGGRKRKREGEYAGHNNCNSRAQQLQQQATATAFSLFFAKHARVLIKSEWVLRSAYFNFIQHNYSSTKGLSTAKRGEGMQLRICL